jgi:hypothetical protein
MTCGQRISGNRTVGSRALLDESRELLRPSRLW